MHPLIYQIWHFISSHSYYQEADFATHAGGTPGRALKLFFDGVWGPSSETLPISNLGFFSLKNGRFMVFLFVCFVLFFEILQIGTHF